MDKKYYMNFEDSQEYIQKRGLDVPWNDCDIFIDEKAITRTVGNVLLWADEHPIHYDGQAMLHVLHKGVMQGKKEMLDRVIEWLNNNLRSYGAHYYFVDQDKLNKDLRKAMEDKEL